MIDELWIGKIILGHDKMILYLVAAHASIFKTALQAFFWLNQRVKLFLCHS